MILRPYCTYLTVYYGNKMPMFYIGYTSTEKFLQKGFDGYRGSVSSRKYAKIWKSELKYNSHLFKTIPVSFHQTKEEALGQETKFQVQLRVVNSDLYINQGIWYHNQYNRKGVKHSIKTKMKISENRKGKGGNGGSPETIANISKSLIGHSVSDETKKKISKSLKGKSKSDDFKLKVSNTMKGRPKSPESIKKRLETLKLKKKEIEYGKGNLQPRNA